jgi:3-deoxy-manno-octulosonate cytidylyltransferase (CMP-KDO synthetase)
VFKVVIPARYASSRLPGKVLLPLAGKPMLQWVYECACAAKAEEVVIATDDERVAAAARAFAKQVIMSEAGHQSGTDRVAEIAARLGWGDGAIVVNAQADEPLLPPQLLQQVAAVLALHPQADIATLATPIDNLAEFLDPNVVKLVTDERQRALYFSRAPIPWARDAAPAGLRSQTQWQGARRHRGLYAYRVAALRRMASLPPSALETTEKLEQLRALEAGFDIRVSDCSVPPGPDVNTSEDYARVSALFAARS